MPQDLTPIEQRPTPYLEAKFDRLCSNALVRNAIEAIQIMHELGRRQMIAEAMAQQANQNSDMAPPGSVLIEMPSPDNLPEDIARAILEQHQSPQPAAGENADAAANDDPKEVPHGAAG